MSITDYTRKPGIGNPIGTYNNENNVDKRIRIRCRPGQESIIYGNPNVSTNPMSILHQTNGIIFPFTPSINVKQSPSWSNQNLTHSLQDYYYFKSIQSTEIGIVGKFTAQNYFEGRYVLAVLHFLRSYSKMHYGTSETDEKRGLPPPVLLLDGYGSYIFNSLPVIILDWSFELPSDIDYVKVVFDPNTSNNNPNLSSNNLIFKNAVNSRGQTISGVTASNPVNSNLQTNSENLFRNNIQSISNSKNVIKNELSKLSENEASKGFNSLDQNSLKNIIGGDVDLNLPTKNLINNTLTPINNSNASVDSSTNYDYGYVPAITTITINLVVQRPPTTLKREFNLQDFREGRLISRKGFI